VVTGADFNGDGLTDIAVLGSQNRYVYLSNGDGTFTLNYSVYGGSFGVPPTINYAMSVDDITGDGVSDQVFVGSTYQYVFTATGPRPDLITSFAPGLGAATAVTYTPITNSAIYTKDTNSVYPKMDMQLSMYVVSRVDAPNGIGGTYSSTYSYAGAKADLSGRGFLGFRQMTVKDLQTNITDTTNYRQDFPYIGMVASTTRTLGSQTLGQSTNTYQFANASGGTAIGPTNAPYRVSLSQNVSSGADLDGSALPTVTTSNQYDAYLNATQVVVSTPDGFSKTTTNIYTNDATNWYLGRLTRASVANVAP